MSIQDLYQQLILDHAKHPRNFGVDPEATHHQCGHNKICGDQLTIFIRLKDNIIEKVSFAGKGCAISLASASLLTQALTGKTQAEAQAIFNAFHELLTAENISHDLPVDLGKLKVMAGVRAFPIRVKCASLAWHTFNSALAADSNLTTGVSTE